MDTQQADVDSLTPAGEPSAEKGEDLSKKQHRQSPVNKPKGNYTQPEGNDAYDMLEMAGVEFSEERLASSLYLIECPECRTRLYGGADYQKWIVGAQAQAALIGFKSFQILGP